MIVQLSPAEIVQAATVGVMRQVQNIKAGRRPAHGAGDRNDWQLHVEGALGEFALAKLTGCFWSGAHAFGQLDVGHVQVRTRSRHEYQLIVHKDDEDDHVFVLVTGRNGNYDVRGWICGKAAKNPQWWCDPAGGRPAFFVPHSALDERVDALFKR